MTLIINNILLISISVLSSIAVINAQTEWIKYEGNPILREGNSGDWDYPEVLHPMVIVEDGHYKMWYVGFDGASDRIGYATSSDGIDWVKEASNPIIHLGEAGSWESVFAGGPMVIHQDTVYKMWYDGFDGTFEQIGYATSTDGINWTKYAGNPIMKVGAAGGWEDTWVSEPMVLYMDGIYKMWYDGADDDGSLGTAVQIGYATSPDGISWTRYENNPVLKVGAAGQLGDRQVSEPWVVYNNSTYHMWYTTNVGALRHIGYATSADGINWTKHDSLRAIEVGPTGSWEDTRLASGSVYFDGNTWHKWYMGFNDTNWRLGYATSPRRIDQLRGHGIVPSYLVPGIDTARISAVFFEQQGISLAAEIEFPPGFPLDTVPLFNDGLHDDELQDDSLFATFWTAPGSIETEYQIDLLVTHVDSDTVNYQIDNIGAVTTIGPVLFDSYSIILPDTVPESGDKVFFKITLKNGGSATTATDISASITPLDTCALNISASNSVYGDIVAGSLAEVSGNYSFEVGTGCTDLSNVAFELSISSHNSEFWKDSFAMDFTLLNIGSNEIVLKDFELEQNYPNPFNPTTTIKFNLPNSGDTTLIIYNILGQEIDRLVNEYLSAGIHSFEWEATEFSSGLYFYELSSGDFNQTRKMVLLK